MLEVVEFPDRRVRDVVEEPLVGAVDCLSAEDFRPDIERQVRKDLDVIAVVGKIGERCKPEPGCFLAAGVVIDAEVDVRPRPRPPFGNGAVEDDKADPLEPLNGLRPLKRMPDKTVHSLSPPGACPEVL